MLYYITEKQDAAAEGEDKICFMPIFARMEGRKP